MSMPTVQAVSCLRVPVSKTECDYGQLETGAIALIGTNQRHMQRLVGVLVHTYGWVLGQDGNLYAPDSSMAWGERVA